MHNDITLSDYTTSIHAHVCTWLVKYRWTAKSTTHYYSGSTKLHNGASLYYYSRGLMHDLLNTITLKSMALPLLWSLPSHTPSTGTHY